MGGLQVRVKFQHFGSVVSSLRLSGVLGVLTLDETLVVCLDLTGCTDW